MRHTSAAIVVLGIATFAAHPATADEPPPPAPAVRASLATPAGPRADDDARQLRFTVGVSLATLGALGVVVGSVLGARAIVSKNDIGAHCSPAATCDLVGYTLGSEAQDFARASTVMFAIGLASAAAGIGLLVSARPGTPPRTAWIGLAPRGVAAVVRW